MRIIGGQWRSRLIALPRNPTTRPMTDRVREAVFDILGSYYGTLGGLPSLTVADVFAGSGSLGLEAVSRGARACWFFETNPEAIKTLRANVDSFEAPEALHIHRHDVWGRGLVAPTAGVYDLIFLDPPYADSRDSAGTGRVARLLNRSRERGALSSDAVVVLHHDARVHYADAPADGWQVFDRRKYGNAGVILIRQESGEPLSHEANGA